MSPFTPEDRSFDRHRYPTEHEGLPGKEGLHVFDDPALNAETAAHFLDSPITPVERFFLRNNGDLPDCDLGADSWTLTVDGAVTRPLRLSPRMLEREFDVVSVTAVLECAGNGRAFIEGETPGVQWTNGAVGCARFTGVRLADILHRAGLAPEAVYVAHESPDRETGGDGPALSRGLPLWKALSEETLVAFAMNNRPLPPLHGAPLRIVAPGFPGSAWQKWLSRVWVRDRVHDGVKMNDYDYRMPTRPVAIGEVPDPSEMAVIEDMPVKSLITHPAEGAQVSARRPLSIRGFAWSGHTPVARVEVSTDGGETFSAVDLEPAEGRFAWNRFRLNWTPSRPGPVTLVARAFDARGGRQPLDSSPWNPRGYCGNSAQRLAIEVV